MIVDGRVKTISFAKSKQFCVSYSSNGPSSRFDGFKIDENRPLIRHVLRGSEVSMPVEDASSSERYRCTSVTETFVSTILALGFLSSSSGIGQSYVPETDSDDILSKTNFLFLYSYHDYRDDDERNRLGKPL